MFVSFYFGLNLKVQTFPSSRRLQNLQRRVLSKLTTRCRPLISTSTKLKKWVFFPQSGNWSQLFYDVTNSYQHKVMNQNKSRASEETTQILRFLKRNERILKRAGSFSTVALKCKSHDQQETQSVSVSSNQRGAVWQRPTHVPVDVNVVVFLVFFPLCFAPQGHRTFLRTKQ